MLTVTKYDVSDITDTKSVYQDRSGVYVIQSPLRCPHPSPEHLPDARIKIFSFGIPRSSATVLLRCQMTIFSMDRDRIFRFDQGIDQLDLLLAGMSGYVGILEDNLRTLHGELVDNLGYCLLISRNRVGTENDRIIRLDRDLLVDICSHTGQSRHGLALASCRDQDCLLIRIILQLVDLDQCILRDTLNNQVLTPLR